LLIKGLFIKSNEILEEMGKIKDSLKSKSLETMEFSKKCQKLTQELDVTRSQYEAKISQIIKENEEKMIGAMQQIERLSFYNGIANPSLGNANNIDKNNFSNADKMEIEKKKNITLVTLKEERKKGKEMRKNQNTEELDNIQNTLLELTNKNLNIKEKEKRDNPLLGTKRDEENSKKLNIKLAI
jgi:hypothetical protein